MEKDEVPTVTQLEHITTDDSTAKHKLELQRTLHHVDIENRYAFKGDDSDRKIEWTVRKLFAAAFLAMLYTGKFPSRRRSKQWNPVRPDWKLGSQILL